MGTGPVQMVEAPAPARRPFGLETVASVITDNPRWLNGINVRRFPLGPADVFDPDPCVDQSPPLSLTTDRDPGENADDPYRPFGVKKGMDCTGFAALDLAAFQARITASYEAVAWQSVEAEFYDSGALGQACLRSTASLVGTTGVPLVQALGELEQAFGDLAAMLGVLHVSESALAYLRHNQVVWDRNGRLETGRGTPVVVSAGYDGAEPGTATAPSATEQYLYMSGQVAVRRSDLGYIGDTPAQVLERQHNLLEVRGVRYFTIAWDHDAVLARLANLHT